MTTSDRRCREPSPGQGIPGRNAGKRLAPAARVHCHIAESGETDSRASRWTEAYARNHKIPMQWGEKGTRKENHVLPALRRMEKKNVYSVYFIFKSMEQGRAFRIAAPKFPPKDPNHRILAHQRSRFTHYYFYIRDAVLGPIIVRVASFSRFMPPIGSTVIL